MIEANRDDPLDIDFPRFMTAGSILGLTLGFLIGTWAHGHPSGFFDGLAAVTGPIGRAWINALMMIVIPLIVSYLVLATAGVGTKASAKLGGLSFGLFLAMLIGAAMIPILLGPPLMRFVPTDPGGIAAAMSAAADQTSAVTESRLGYNLGDWLVSLFPPNPVRAAADGDILGIVVVSLVFGLALARLGARGEPMIRLMKSIRDATLVVTIWILWPLPLAAFALAYNVGMVTGAAMVGPLGYWILIASGALVLLTLLLYPVTAWLGRISIGRFASGVWPSQTVAVSTRSSLASLPALLQGGEDRLQLPSDVVGLTLPLAVSTFKINVLVTLPLQLIFLTTLFGVPLDPAYLIVFVGISIMLSFAQPGIPSGTIAMVIPFFVDAGVPAEAVVMIYVIDAIPDIFKTLVNVTADMSVAVIVARFVGWRSTDQRVPQAVPPLEAGA